MFVLLSQTENATTSTHVVPSYAGKSTLTDSLVAAAGIMALEQVRVWPK